MELFDMTFKEIKDNAYRFYKDDFQMIVSILRLETSNGRQTADKVASILSDYGCNVDEDDIIHYTLYLRKKYPRKKNKRK